MGRGANTTSGVVAPRRQLSIAEAFPMNHFMEEIAERLTEIDGGLECPTCLSFYPAQGGDTQGRALIGECPEHGQFTIDVTEEYQEAVNEYEDPRAF